MVALSTTSNIQNPDDLYALLLEAHDKLSEEESAALNVKLVLILANHIGDLSVLAGAIAAASTGSCPTQS